METEIIQIDIDHMDSDRIAHAAEIIARGGLVAFPTETVYGLGANALDEKAVKNIFQAKGRPSDNPLIVHISDADALDKLVSEIPAITAKLIEAFWPGPLTLVMRKSQIVPDIITAGLDTVAVRMPAHPVALALIRQSGLPIAAPSANKSGKPSPTRAGHVIEDLSGKIDAVIDAGNADVGLESTVLDITSDPPVILRPGGITPDQIAKVAGAVDIDPALLGGSPAVVKPRSPGLKYTHYSPRAQVIVVEGIPEKAAAKISEMARELRQDGKKVGVLSTDETKGYYRDAEIISAGSRLHPETVASNLFRILREFDERQVDVILAEAIESTGIGIAVMNRLNKAAGYNIIRV